MQITAKVNFGEDLGQNIGTVFEARDSNGQVLFGAGFMGLFNTHFRMDRWTLQFFVRHDGGEVTYEKLPFPSDDGGNYLFDLDGKVYQFSNHLDRTARWYDDESKTWVVDERFGVKETTSGEGMMRLAGKLLQFKGGEAWYDGAKILMKPDEGHYHHFYYSHGHLVFYQNKWHFVRRMFEHPAITDEMNHPWEDRVIGYNEIHGEEVVWNGWGNRTTGMVPMDDSLFISTSAKGCSERDMRMEFLHDDEVWNEYRTVHRLRKPGCVAGPVAWREGETTLEFIADGDRIAIAQDGAEIASAPADPKVVANVETARIEWGKGMYGPFAGDVTPQ